MRTEGRYDFWTKDQKLPVYFAWRRYFRLRARSFQHAKQFGGRRVYRHYASSLFLFGLDPAITNLALNIPLFFIGWKLLGRQTFLYTVIGTVAVSVFLSIFQRYMIHMPLRHDMTLAALFAGVVYRRRPRHYFPLRRHNRRRRYYRPPRP
ncbi:hypothetical protein DI43_11140 [Geobacillus sp. CAMR12739]|nr:hypothetical protein DI43_11140 [Geobacillus sp. CAMR12739]